MSKQATAAVPVEREQPNEWLTPATAAEYLLLSKRRVLELIHERGWQTEKRRTPGSRQAVTMIRFNDVKEHKTKRRQPRTAAKRGPPAWVQLFDHGVSDLANKMGQLLTMQMQVLDRFDETRTFMQRVAAAANSSALSSNSHRYISIVDAASYLGLTTAFLEQACESGHLPYVWDGPTKQRHRMVRISDLKTAEFGSAGPPRARIVNPRFEAKG
jgi:hypothetical protein